MELTRRVRVAVLAALLAMAGLFAAGTPLTHGTIDRDAAERLGGP